MSIISMVEPAQASGKVAEVYGQVQQLMGRVPNGIALLSASPDVMAMHWQSIGYFMQHPSLSFPMLAMARMLISQDNHCEYCVGMNEGMLINMAGLTPEQVAATKRNPADAPLTEKDKTMLLFMLKSVKSPAAVSKADMDQLKGLGWNESDILDAASHAAQHVAIDIVFNVFKIDNDL